jgi:hypothetical protein
MHISLVKLAVILLLTPGLAAAGPARQARTLAAGAAAPALGGFILRATSGELDTQQAAGRMLHLLKGQTAVELLVAGVAGGEAVASAAFESRAGVISVISATSAMWYLPPEVQGEGVVLRVKAVGVSGGSLTHVFPVRFHEHRREIKQAGKLFDLTVADTAGYVQVKASGAAAAYQQDTAGLFARVGRGQGLQGVAVTLLPLPAAQQKLTVSAAVKVSEMELGTEFALAVSSATATVATLAVRNDTGRLVKRLTLADGTSMEQNVDVRNFVGYQMMLSLSVDPATGVVSGFDSWTSKSLQGSLSVGGTMLTPVLSVTRRDGGAVGVTFAAAWSNQQVAVTQVDADGAVCKASAALACRDLGGNQLLVVQPAATDLHKINVRGTGYLAEGTEWAASQRVSSVALEYLHPVAGTSTMLQ